MTTPEPLTPDLWSDLEAESRTPGPTMTITKAQYAALQQAVEQAATLGPAEPTVTFARVEHHVNRALGLTSDDRTALLASIWADAAASMEPLPQHASRGEVMTPEPLTAAEVAVLHNPDQWYEAFAMVSGDEARTPEGRRVIYTQWRAALRAATLSPAEPPTGFRPGMTFGNGGNVLPPLRPADAAENCNHTNWCACTKYRRNDGNEHLGHQPQNEKSGMLRTSPTGGGNPKTDAESNQRGMDKTHDGNDDNGERGYGATEEDHILIFE